MSGWAIALILLILFYGPVYVTMALIGFAAAVAPGTAAAMPYALFIFMLILFGAPFAFVGYMMVKHDDRQVKATETPETI